MCEHFKVEEYTAMLFVSIFTKRDNFHDLLSNRMTESFQNGVKYQKEKFSTTEANSFH